MPAPEMPCGAPTSEAQPKSDIDRSVDAEIIRSLQKALQAKQSTDSPWAKCAKQAWDYEESVIRSWQEQINNWILIAGLISAALTVFVAPYYTSIQPNLQLDIIVAASARFLLTADNQEYADAIESGDIRRTIVLSSPIDPTKAAVAETVNILWISALILTLGVASTAISVNQWLYTFPRQDTELTRQSVRMWSFLRRGLMRWRVPVIINLLPIMLQLALSLFLIGLVQLLWTANKVAAYVIMVMVAVIVAVPIVTALVPSVSPDCPFKSPQAWWILRIWVLIISIRPVQWPRRMVRLIKRLRKRPSKLLSIFLAAVMCVTSYFLRYYRFATTLPSRLQWYVAAAKVANWRQFEDYAVRTKTAEEDDSVKLLMLAEADSVVMDESFLTSVVRPCLEQNKIKASQPVLLRILQHRAHEVESHSNGSQTLKWFSSEQDSTAIIAMGQLCLDMLYRHDVLRQDNREQGQIVQHLLYLIRAMPDSQSAKDVCSHAEAQIRNHNLQWLSWINEQDVGKIRMCDLAIGAGPCFREFVGQEWINKMHEDPSIFKTAVKKMSYNGKNEVLRICAATSELCRGMYTMSVDDSYKIRVLAIICACLETMPTTTEATAYWLIHVSSETNVAPRVQAELTNIILCFLPKFRASARLVEALFAYLPHAEAKLESTPFLQIVCSALRLSTDLAPSDFSQSFNKETIKDALALVNNHIKSLSTERLAVSKEIWALIRDIIQACSNLFDLDSDLKTEGVVGILQSICINYPRDGAGYDAVEKFMKNIQGISLWTNMSWSASKHFLGLGVAEDSPA